MTSQIEFAPHEVSRLACYLLEAVNFISGPSYLDYTIIETVEKTW